MPTRKVARRRLKKNAIGDRRDRVLLHTRGLEAPGINSATFTEEYNTGKGLWSKVETLNLQGAGLNVFDSVNLNDERPTHRITIRFRSGVTAENVIGWRGSYYKILSIINPEERNEDLELYCTLKGDKDFEANQ